jgi:hypothetical protein
LTAGQEEDGRIRTSCSLRGFETRMDNMKAKESMRVLLYLELVKRHWASRARLFGGFENNPFVLPVFPIVSFVVQRSAKMAVCLAAVVILFGGFCVPAIGEPTLDLTEESSGSIGVAFVRLSTNQEVAQGYNTAARPLMFDENNSPQFTRELLLSSVPVVDIGGTDYREFLLDINQNGTVSGRVLSLDTIEIYLANAGNLTGYPANLGTKIYDLDAGDSDNWILLDYKLNHGSGSGDMFAYIPDSLFVGGEYVYLYSKFGESENEAYPNNAGFEEWAVRIGEPLAIIPAPGAVVLGSIGVCFVGWLRRRRTL